MGEIINPVQIIVEGIMAKRRALMAIPLAEAVELHSSAVAVSGGVRASAAEVGSSAPVELSSVAPMAIVENLEQAGSVEEVVASLVDSELFLTPARLDPVAHEMQRVVAESDVDVAREFALEMVSETLVPAHQEVLQENLRERLLPALGQIGEAQVTATDAQFVAQIDGGTMTVEPVSYPDGSVRLNVAADFEDLSCTQKLGELCDALQREGVNLSQLRTLPKAPPPEQRLRLRRL